MKRRKTKTKIKNTKSKKEGVENNYEKEGTTTKRGRASRGGEGRGGRRR